jgi:hypothetical protein
MPKRRYVDGIEEEIGSDTIQRRVTRGEFLQKRATDKKVKKLLRAEAQWDTYDPVMHGLKTLRARLEPKLPADVKFQDVLRYADHVFADSRSKRRAGQIERALEREGVDPDEVMPQDRDTYAARRKKKYAFLLNNSMATAKNPTPLLHERLPDGSLRRSKITIPIWINDVVGAKRYRVAQTPEELAEYGQAVDSDGTVYNAYERARIKKIMGYGKHAMRGGAAGGYGDDGEDGYAGFQPWQSFGKAVHYAARPLPVSHSPAAQLAPPMVHGPGMMDITEAERVWPASASREFVR